MPWNDSCANGPISIALGFSTPYGSDGACNDPVGQQFLNTIGGGGGPSECATGTPSIGGVVSGTCAGYAKPSWQNILGVPSDGVRDTPDVSETTLFLVKPAELKTTLAGLANGALALAKQLGRKPRDVADDVVGAANLAGKATLEVAGPGFINVTFDEVFLKEQLHSLEIDDRLVQLACLVQVLQGGGLHESLIVVHLGQARGGRGP